MALLANTVSVGLGTFCLLRIGFRVGASSETTTGRKYGGIAPNPAVAPRRIVEYTLYSRTRAGPEAHPKPIQSDFGWEMQGRPQRPKTPIQNVFGWEPGLDGDGWGWMGQSCNRPCHTSRAGLDFLLVVIAVSHSGVLHK